MTTPFTGFAKMQMIISNDHLKLEEGKENYESYESSEPCLG